MLRTPTELLGRRATTGSASSSSCSRPRSGGGLDDDEPDSPQVIEEPVPQPLPSQAEPLPLPLPEEEDEEVQKPRREKGQGHAGTRAFVAWPTQRLGPSAQLAMAVGGFFLVRLLTADKGRPRTRSRRRRRHLRGATHAPAEGRTPPRTEPARGRPPAGEDPVPSKPIAATTLKLDGAASTHSTPQGKAATSCSTSHAPATRRLRCRRRKGGRRRSPMSTRQRHHRLRRPRPRVRRANGQAHIASSSTTFAPAAGRVRNSTLTGDDRVRHMARRYRLRRPARRGHV